MKNIIVLGGGVSGLTCGVVLAEAGYGVTVWARELPQETTSWVAAAIWHPFKVAPLDRVVEWGRRSFEIFCQLAEEEAGSGVSVREGLEIHSVPTPEWSGYVRNFRAARPADMPQGRTEAGGYVFETPVIEMPIYLVYLQRRLERAGGLLVQREARSLAEGLAASESGLMVNCTGLASRELAGDDELYPIRGQIVRVAPPPTARFMLDEDGEEADGQLSYIVPRSADVILGGTAQVGEWSLEPDAAVAAAIVARCAQLVPGLADPQVRVVEHLVGLRPGRSAVRLEAETVEGAAGQGADENRRAGVIVHNYGHGGAGVTLSWGCAEEVLSLVRESLG